jgi:microcystin-dependent protein
MADSFSTLLNLRLQQTGGNSNTWGDLLNSDVFVPLENAIAGRTSYTVTGGTLDLSAAPIQHGAISLQGTLTADQTIILPNLSKQLLVFNNLAGAFALLLKTATGGAIAIPQATQKRLYCDGAGNLYRDDRAEVGEIKFFATTTAPPGYYPCDGRAISRAANPDLFAAIGTTWGPGNGATTFNVPDLVTNNRYLRAAGGALSVGQTQTDDVKPHNHTASASTSGSVSLSIVGDGGWTPSIFINDPSHTHAVGGTSANVVKWTAGGGDGGSGGPSNLILNSTISNATTGITATSTGIGNHAHAGSSASLSASTSVIVNNSSGGETRPHSAVALICIRY